MKPQCTDLGESHEGDPSGPTSVARAFFFDSPAAALMLLAPGGRSTAGDPLAPGVPPPPASSLPDDRERAWLTGCALGALGRFGAAAAVLRPLAETGDGPFASLAWSTLASHQRQIGRHADALVYDRRAERMIPTGSDPLSVTARFDAELGLAADAVGLGRTEDAVERLPGGELLSGAEALPLPVGLEPRPDPVSAEWRRRVRRGWVATEIALLRGDPADAVALAEAALTEAVVAGAPRHVAKCRLFLGASRYVRYRDVSAAPGVHRGVVDGGNARGGAERILVEARSALTQAVAASATLGALPLRWVAESLLADVLVLADEPDAVVAEHRRSAATVVTAIGADLPVDQRSGWLSRPDLAALLAAVPQT